MMVLERVSPRNIDKRHRVLYPYLKKAFNLSAGDNWDDYLLQIDLVISTSQLSVSEELGSTVQYILRDNI